MKNLKIAILLLVIPAFAFTVAHKYYVSVTKIAYVKEKESVQIISRIFIDDFENLLRKRYDEKITLAIQQELPTVNMYTERYLKEKFQIAINGKPAKLNFIGKEYEDDVMLCYLEIEDVKAINSIEISNKVLLDLFPEQENIIRCKINGKNKSFLLREGNLSRLLNFN
ncbi:peptidase E [Lacinutrix sp. C3R15]|uniref:DUF6702 family protein n=1 Tax=Flavobacteriaceae TaxID=49546 RepID=UPI001C086F0A|nr:MULTISPECIES: DUF6702 family protein [Flavobacteriaceae]MBU2939297.1 peptidase E [Lacinutrix sp. C3R15]MDO6622612.1 peptidase E [Oceanihabitans sp. 1_MG-2023]